MLEGTHPYEDASHPPPQHSSPTYLAAACGPETRPTRSQKVWGPGMDVILTSFAEKLREQKVKAQR